MSNLYLEHHGIKGMKWGVRRYQNPDGSLTSAGRSRYGYPMTKREAKKAIKKAKRAERKRSGNWMSTGKYDASVRKAHRNEIENDETLKEISKRREAIGNKISKTESIIEERKKDIERAETMKEHLREVQNDPEQSRDVRREVERHYLSDKEQAAKSKEAISKESERLEKLWDKYNAEDAAYHKRNKEIGNKYINLYKEAAVKDLGIEDVQLGMQMLEDYGLMEKAARLRWKVGK